MKDYVIGRLISKWIIEAESVNLEPNSPYFQHYKNIKLNSEFSENKLLLGFKIVEGSAEEMFVEVDWMEMFKYWTEIKTKYHIESEEEDNEIEDIQTDKLAKCSEIRIKNLNLRIETQISTQDKDEPANINPGVDVDILKDFLNHMVGQFKVTIDGITLILNENNPITLNCNDLITIQPEINGIRRIQLSNINLERNGTVVALRKGSEISITRTIENLNVKIEISEIDIETEEISALYNFKSSNQLKTEQSSLSYEITCNVFILKFNELKLVINDIYFNDSGQFITGHFNLKWKGSILLNSPIQTQVIRGNLKESYFEIDEELYVTLDNVRLIEDVLKLFKNVDTVRSHNHNTVNISCKALHVKIEEYQVLIDHLIVKENQITIKSVDIVYQNSQILLQDIEFMRSEEKTINNIFTLPPSPFAELKRFIENDEILSLEKKESLYSWFIYRDQLLIQKAKGKLLMHDFNAAYTNNNNSSSSANFMSSRISLIGIVNELNLDIFISETCDIAYQIQLNEFEFLTAADSFVDFRGHLKNFKRNDKLLLHSGRIGCTAKAADICVIEFENLEAHVPYNVIDLMTLDIKQIKCKKNESSDSKSIILQVVMKNSKFDLEAPEPQSDQIVQSQFNIQEVTLKMDTNELVTMYLNDVQIQLDDYAVFNSGLLKLSATSSNSMTIRNHCSHLTLSPDSFEKLKKFVQFWSEIYSPIIQEIVPEAIYFEASRTNAPSPDDDRNNAGMVIESKGEGEDDNLELELDIFFEEEDEEVEFVENEAFSYSEKELSSLKLYEPMASNPKQDLMELLNEIDEEFFVNKKEKSYTYSSVNFLKIVDFGLEISLILPETSFKMSLNGIDGRISADSIEFKVKEGSLVEKKEAPATSVSSVVLGRWQKGPDVTCKYPIEDGNFMRIQAEKIEKNQKGIDEFNLVISICPLRLFLDQRSLNSLGQFFKREPFCESADKSVGVMRGFIFFNKVNISALALKLDYNPNAGSAGTPAIPLQGAEMILPRIELRGIKGFEGLGPAIFSAWIPELRGSKLAGVLKTGLVPVRTIVNLGGGVVELILLPWQLGTKDISGSGSAAQTVAHIRRSSKQIGLETLKLTTTIANQTSKLLGASRTAPDYPKDFQSGVQQAAQLIIALPTRIHQQNQQKGAIRAVPLLILDSAATATGALAKTLQGIQAEFDRDTGLERKLKQKQK